MAKAHSFVFLASIVALIASGPTFAGPAGGGQADVTIHAAQSGSNTVQTGILLHARHELRVRAWCYDKNGNQIWSASDFEFQVTEGATAIDVPTTGYTLKFDLAERATARIEFIPRSNASKLGHCHIVWDSDNAVGGPALSGRLGLFNSTDVAPTAIAHIPDF